jgi:hypothetical protein
MEILSTAIYHIDHSKTDVAPVPIPDDNADLSTYIEELLAKIAKDDSNRLFSFVSETGEGHTNITDLLNKEHHESATRQIARRLLYKEQNKQADIAHLIHDIPRGVLIIILFEDDNGSTRLIISKADHARYLNEQDFTLEQGLPYEKKTYKAFLADLDEENEVERIYIYDTNAKIAKYWYEDFLELKEVNTDEFNTGTAFDAIEKNILNKFKNDFPSDYHIIRNRVIGYFRSKESFELQEFIDEAIGADYDPVNPAFKPKISDITKKIKDLPSKKNFDSQFTIEKSTIKARQVNSVVKLNDTMDLHIKDFVGDLHQVIKAVEENGLKYIKIRTDEGYKAFKEKDVDAADQ